MMTHKIQPSMNDCLMVSQALHMKFKFLGDESSKVGAGCQLYNVVTEFLQMVFI